MRHSGAGACPAARCEEVVRNGISGFVCQSAEEMVQRVAILPGIFKPAKVRQYCQQYFSVDRMVADYLALYQELAGEDSPVGKTAITRPAGGLSRTRRRQCMSTYLTIPYEQLIEIPSPHVEPRLAFRRWSRARSTTSP